MNEETAERLVQRLIDEYRRYRRGRWVTRGIWLAVLIALIAAPWIRDLSHERGAHTALVDLQGVIGIGGEASAERINEGLRAAFENNHVKGIILRINSPGGSPVQARQINAEIDRLQREYPDVPVFAVVDEICASGAYYVAVAADEIYADPASIVGSIGVRLDSFGLVEAIDKLGVERRLITAGERKGFLDPFLPMSGKDREFAKDLLDTVHRQFIDAVKAGRGERLAPGDVDVFSGLFWGGEDAMRMGLVDGYGTVDSIAREVVGEETIINYTPEFDLWERVAREVRTGVSSAMHALLYGGTATLR